MKKYIKRNIKILMSFTLGAIIFGRTIYAITVLSYSYYKIPYRHFYRHKELKH